MIKIITDSCARLKDDYIKKFDIEVVELNLSIEENNYKVSDIALSEVLKNMENKKKVTTSQPSPNDFLTAINKQIEKGATTVIVITVSSGLSGTYQSATIAADLVENDNVNVLVYSSNSTSIAQEAVVRKVNELTLNVKKIGKEEDFLIKNYCDNVTTILSIDDIGTLVKTGRISKLKGTVATVMKYKPIIEIIKTKAEMVKKIRTTKRVIDYMYERVLEESKKHESLEIYISYIGDMEIANKVKNTLDAIENVTSHISNEIGPVLAVHLGNGGIGIGFTYKSVLL